MEGFRAVGGREDEGGEGVMAGDLRVAVEGRVGISEKN